MSYQESKCFVMTTCPAVGVCAEPSTITVSVAPAITAGSATLNGSFNGTSNTSLLVGSDTVAAGASVTVTFTVQLSYASTANLPLTAQNNSVYATTTSTGTNAGYTFVGGAPVPPVDLLATDTSTNGSALPASAITPEHIWVLRPSGSRPRQLPNS